jgi:cytidylate kinase
MKSIKKPYLLAIDGPAGSGKGTVAKLLSKKLNLNYLDSGAIYRLIALSAMEKKVDLENDKNLVDLIRKVDINFVDEQIFLNNSNVSKKIRYETVGKSASIIAKHLKLRKEILTFQRKFFQGNGLVAEGRDMTTVVFPNADLKIYLDASVKERAKRRYKQLMTKGKDVSIQNLTDDIVARDKLDMERIHSPLSVADDAFVLNSDDLNIDQTVNKIIKLI